MNLFNVNHDEGGFLDPCKCALRERRGLPAVRNQINLDTLTDVTWEDGMWIVYFGDVYYRIHDKDKMALLEAELEMERPK